VAGPHHGGHRLGVQQLERHAAHHRRLGHPANGEVELAGRQRVKQFRVMRHPDRAGGIRAARVQPGDRPGQQAAGHGVQRADVYGGGLDRAGAAERGGGRVHSLGDFGRVPQELLPRRGQRGARPPAVHEVLAGHPLQLRQRLGDGGLAHVQPRGGAGEGPLLGHGHEAAQVPQPHPGERRRGHPRPGGHGPSGVGLATHIHNRTLRIPAKGVNLLH
jgi:hypothetical protein